MKAPASCQEYFDNLVRDDGVYLIQPSLDFDPFNVTCTFNETSGIATTVLFHTHEKQFQYTSLPGSSDGCADPGCFRDKISYDANFKQLQALIDISDNCYQTILHNCTSNALTSYSWWVDRFGNNVTYWHGDKETEAEGCECSEDDSCDTGHGGGADNLCNCDDRDNMNIDYGVLTSRDQLPVMELAYGDSQYRYSWIHYTLGDFTCEGKRWIYPSEIHDNDFAVKVGWTRGPSCNYDYLTTSCSKIDFNQLIYDRSLGSWDINTFTAPVDGFYKFNLHLNYNKNSHASYKLRLYRITEDGTTIGRTCLLSCFGLSFKILYSADRHGENYYYYQTGTGYPNTQNFISDIYLKKGEQAYYNTEYTAASNHNLNGWTDCETIPGEKHSCTWLEIRKSGEMTVKDPEF